MSWSIWFCNPKLSLTVLPLIVVTHSILQVSWLKEVWLREEQSNMLLVSQERDNPSVYLIIGCLKLFISHSFCLFFPFSVSKIMHDNSQFKSGSWNQIHWDKVVHKLKEEWAVTTSPEWVVPLCLSCLGFLGVLGCRGSIPSKHGHGDSLWYNKPPHEPGCPLCQHTPRLCATSTNPPSAQGCEPA